MAEFGRWNQAASGRSLTQDIGAYSKIAGVERVWSWPPLWSKSSSTCEVQLLWVDVGIVNGTPVVKNIFQTATQLRTICFYLVWPCLFSCRVRTTVGALWLMYWDQIHCTHTTMIQTRLSYQGRWSETSISWTGMPCTRLACYSFQSCSGRNWPMPLSS